MAEPTLEFHPSRGGLMLNRGGDSLVEVERVVRLPCGDRLMVKAADNGRDYQFGFDAIVRAYGAPTVA